MLTSLHIENVAVIESVDITPENGLTVLTGETGAGKSILIDSINMILGSRTTKDIVRTGCKKAFVSAVFDCISPEASSLLTEFGFETDDELLISREITADGRSSAKINGRQITASMLKAIGTHLVNIHGQHDTTTLSDPETHIGFLDAFGLYGDEKARYREAYNELCETKRRLEALNVDEAEKERRIDILTYQINEIESADLTVGEDKELEQRRYTLINAEKVIEGLNSATAILSGDNSLKDLTAAVENELMHIAKYDRELADYAEKMTDLAAELDDISESIRDYADNFEFDAEELEETEERLELIKKFRKKYGNTIEEMLSFCENAKKELENIELSDERTKELTETLFKQRQLMNTCAEELSKKRKEAAKQLERDIINELKFLDMPKVEFIVDFKEKEPDISGIDTVEFLISTNVGEEPRPLAKIASGGELSRIMLAVKSILSEESGMTLVFDEIDTGVSGRAAQKIAVKLRSMAEKNQVIVITHLAQIASAGDCHMKISKTTDGQRTFTYVKELGKAERINELALIMGGESITPAMLKTASEMLSANSKK